MQALENIVELSPYLLVSSVQIRSYFESSSDTSFYFLMCSFKKRQINTGKTYKVVWATRKAYERNNRAENCDRQTFTIISQRYLFTFLESSIPANLHHRVSSGLFVWYLTTQLENPVIPLKTWTELTLALSAGFISVFLT